MLKRILYIIIAGLLALALASCGGKDAQNSPPADNAPAKNGPIWLDLDLSYVKEFSGGLAAVCQEDKWGYIDKTGKIAIPITLDAAEPFKDGVAVVAMNFPTDDGPQTSFGLSDKAGEPLALMDYQFIYSFKDGLAVAGLEGKCGFLDKSGQLAIPCEYDSAEDFSDGLALVTKTDTEGFISYGYIDKKGQPAVPFLYEYANSFAEGLALVCRDGKWGFIDTAGAVRIDFIFADALSFGQHLAAVRQDMLWGYINAAGIMVIEPVFIEAKSFANGSAPVLTGRGWQFITLIDYKKGANL